MQLKADSCAYATLPMSNAIAVALELWLLITAAWCHYIRDRQTMTLYFHWIISRVQQLIHRHMIWISRVRHKYFWGLWSGAALLYWLPLATQLSPPRRRMQIKSRTSWLNICLAKKGRKEVAQHTREKIQVLRLIFFSPDFGSLKVAMQLKEGEVTVFFSVYFNHMHFVSVLLFFWFLTMH